MLQEGDPKIREFIKENIYHSFKQLLIEYNGYPKEFTQDTKKFTNYKREDLRNKSDDAMEEQLKEFIDQLRNDYDQENFFTRIHKILIDNKKNIDEDLFDDLIIYLKHGKRRSKS